MSRWTVALCALGVLAFAGCASNDGDSGAGSQAAGAVAPERPADERTAEGSVAFAGHVYDVLQHAYATADPAPVEAVADLELCFGCEQPLATIATAASAGEVLTGDVETSTGDAEVVDETGTSTTVRLDVQSPELTPSGPGVESVPAADAPMLVTMRWDASRWTLVDFAPVGN